MIGLPHLPTGGELGRGGRPLRIGYGRIFHEACAYSPLRTTEDDFRRMHHVSGQALADGASLGGAELESFFPHAEMTGFVQAARLAGGVTAVPLSSSLAVPSGPLTLACFEWVVSELVAAVLAAGHLDGIYLALHGSMEVDGLDEAPEAVILRRVRAAAGDNVKIAASFDLHGNLSAGIVEAVEVLVSYRTNPHWDLAPTGFRAGNRLIRSLRGLCHPVHDPQAVEALWDTAIGQTAAVTLRGTPGYDQPPVPLSGVVAAKYESPQGRRVRLDVGTLHVVVTSHPPLPIHPRFWREMGLSVRSADLMVQKNFFHYRLFHLLSSFRHLPVTSEGATSLRRAAQRDMAVPSWPKADPQGWRDGDRSLRLGPSLRGKKAAASPVVAKPLG